MYDIIDDIHGHASLLQQLLERMGYQRGAQSWRHLDRQAIFVGDFIDRGPEQIETYLLVSAMIDRVAPLAVMGNHDFNAVAFKTPHPAQARERLRPGTERNRNQHAAFPEQVGEDGALYDEMIVWFKMLPLYLDLDDLRLAHACWDDEALKTMKPLLDHRQCLWDEAWLKAARKRTDAYDSAETLLKGLDVPFPAGETLIDKAGNECQDIRTRWWNQGAGSYRSLAMLADATRETLSDEPVPDDVLPDCTDETPLFVGHYWLRRTPQPKSYQMACLDYTLTEPAPEGESTAYRWPEETAINRNRFAWACIPTSF